MKIRSIFYHLKQGFKNIYRNRLFSLASIATIAACVFLFGVFYSIMMNFEYMVKKAENEVCVTVFFDEGLSDTEIKKLGDTISEELGYNYRMSNVVAGVVRGQFPYLDEHIAQKKAIYERYKEGLKDLPVSMNPMDLENSEPNYWLSCLIVDEDAMCKQVRGEQDVCYVKEAGKTCPTEILEAIASINAEGRPIWKPMHMQPIYRLNPFVVRDGNGRARSNAYIAGGAADVGMDIFARGLCLPSDNKMTAEQQDRIIEVIRACFE